MKESEQMPLEPTGESIPVDGAVINFLPTKQKDVVGRCAECGGILIWTYAERQKREELVDVINEILNAGLIIDCIDDIKKEHINHREGCRQKDLLPAWQIICRP